MGLENFGGLLALLGKDQLVKLVWKGHQGTNKSGKLMKGYVRVTFI